MLQSVSWRGRASLLLLLANALLQPTSLAEETIRKNTGGGSKQGSRKVKTTLLKTEDDLPELPDSLERAILHDEVMRMGGYSDEDDSYEDDLASYGLNGMNFDKEDLFTESEERMAAAILSRERHAAASVPLTNNKRVGLMPLAVKQERPSPPPPIKPPVAQRKNAKNNDAHKSSELTASKAPIAKPQPVIAKEDREAAIVPIHREIRPEFAQVPPLPIPLLPLGGGPVEMRATVPPPKKPPPTPAPKTKKEERQPPNKSDPHDVKVNEIPPADKSIMESVFRADDPELAVHDRAQKLIKTRNDEPDVRVYSDGEDIMRSIQAVKGQAVETEKPIRNCQDNEIYIVDGNRTLLLTNQRIAQDIDRIQDSERSLLLRLRRQDRIVEFLKQRLNYSETQMDESMKVLQAQENTYADLVNKINMSEVRLSSVRAQNKILEDQHAHDRVQIEIKDDKIERMRGAMQEKDRVIDDLRREVRASCQCCCYECSNNRSQLKDSSLNKWRKLAIDIGMF